MFARSGFKCCVATVSCSMASSIALGTSVGRRSPVQPLPVALVEMLRVVAYPLMSLALSAANSSSLKTPAAFSSPSF